jgi:hypothetical protein
VQLIDGNIATYAVGLAARELVGRGARAKVHEHESGHKQGDRSRDDEEMVDASTHAKDIAAAKYVTWAVP